MDPGISNPPIPTSHTPVILATAISGLVFLTLGFFLGRNFAPKQPGVTPTPTSNQTNSSPTEIDWKTYTNTEYGYSLKYPPTWNKVIDPRSEDKEFTIESPQKELVHGTIFDAKVTANQDTDYQKTFVLKNSKLLIAYVECDGPGCGFGKLEPQTFRQILSTFKFTADPTANWKTYQSTKYGFIIKYPSNWKTLETPTDLYQTGNDQIWLSPENIGWPPPNTDARSALVFSFSESDPEVNWQPQYFENYSKVAYTLGNMSANKISGTNKEGLFNESVILAKIGSTYLTILNNSGVDAQQHFDQILSTFKFTNSYDKVSWENAKRLILNGQVSSIEQDHNLNVTLHLKNGDVVTTIQPRTDEVSRIINSCGINCRDIIQSTE